MDQVAPKKRKRPVVTSPGVDDQPPDELIESGRAAFASGDYPAAVRAWSRARAGLSARGDCNPRLETALAEAHFRCGILARPVNLDDLSDAIQLAPDEPRYQYHWALARQRLGEIEPAISVYRALLARTPPYTRAAFPLAVALVTSRVQPNKDPVWEFLTDEERIRVSSAYALLKGRPKTAWLTAPHRGADAFWAGLGAFRLPDQSTEKLLREALDAPDLPRTAVAITHHYLGVLAWGRRQPDAALEHWQTAHANGMRTAWLSSNLANACKHAALTLLETPRMVLPQPPAAPSSGNAAEPGAVEDDWHAILAEVLRLAETGLQHAPDDLTLIEIANHARGQLGYRAARAGEWPEAARLLWAAADSGERHRATLTNAALAAEALNRFARAADLWQSVLRHRAQRPGTANSLTKVQTARLWQRVGECFERAGDYEEAARAYRNAMRNQPDDVATQLSLAEVLVKAERYESAAAALAQLLVEQPNHVAALALRAEILEKQGYNKAAIQIWERVLAVDPEHAIARQSLVRLYRDEGNLLRTDGNLRRALAAYNEGLKYMPLDSSLRASVALVRGLQGNTEAAHRELEALLGEQGRDSEVAYWVLGAYLELGDWDAAAALIDRLRAADSPHSVQQLVQLAFVCHFRRRREWCRQLLELAEQQTEDADTLLNIAGTYNDLGHGDQAVRTLERLLSVQPDHAEAHVNLGLYLLQQGKDRAVAEKHFQIAEQLARRSGDSAVMLQARLGLNVIRNGGTA